jgi:hypothetical protein
MEEAITTGIGEDTMTGMEVVMEEATTTAIVEVITDIVEATTTAIAEATTTAIVSSAICGIFNVPVGCSVCV